MPVRVVRLGTPRLAHEGLRLGTVRRPPRGVPKSEFAKRDFYDVWVPDLAPSQELVTKVMSGAIPWSAFVKSYRREMHDASRLIELLAALSKTADFSFGCYCEDETRCHRSVLKELFREAGATFAQESESPADPALPPSSGGTPPRRSRGAGARRRPSH